MTYTSTVTQKGQITIPAKIRSLLKFNQGTTIKIIHTDDNQVLLEKNTDFMNLKGSIKTNKKFNDKEADKKILEQVKKDYERKNSNS